jgi:hypothetical protein
MPYLILEIRTFAGKGSAFTGMLQPANAPLLFPLLPAIRRESSLAPPFIIHLHVKAFNSVIIRSEIPPLTF